MKTRFQVEGLSDLKAVLAELPKSTNRRIGLRALTEVAQPIADRASDLAPVGAGDNHGHHLADVIGVTTKVNRSARRKRKSESPVEVHVGPVYSAGNQRARIGHLVEFGTSHSPAQPFMRPAFDESAPKAFAGLANILGREIQKVVDRRAKRAAKRAARGQ